MKMPAQLPCPCGSVRAPFAWHKRDASFLYRLRCPSCGLMANVSSARPEAAAERWNEAVVQKREAIMWGVRR